MEVLTHNLKVAARRLNVVLDLTAERLSKAAALASTHGLPHGSRGTAFALVALNQISSKLGDTLSARELGVVLRTLAVAHDYCVLGDKNPVTIVQAAIRNLCVTYGIFGADQLPMVYRATPIVEVVREYKVARDNEKAKSSIARAILAPTLKRAVCHIPGIDDDETDLVKLGYM